MKHNSLNGVTRIGLVLGALLIVTVSMEAYAQLPTAAKVMVKDTGFYRVTKADLAAVFAITETEVASADFRVSNVGKPVASVRDGGDVVFFGHQYESIYTDQNVYWVTMESPAALSTRTVGAGTSPFQPFFPDRVHREDELLIRSDLVLNDTEDAFYWRLFTSGLSTKSYTATLSVPAVAPGTLAQITVRLKGATDLLPTRYYHAATVTLNGQLLGSMSFNGLEVKEATFLVTAGQLLPGNNSVKIDSAPPVGTSFDSFLLDFISIDYQRGFVADGNGLVMSAGDGAVEVSGLTSSSVRIWDVSDRWMPEALNGFSVSADGANWRATFEATAGRYAVGAIGAELAPVRVMKASGLDLKASDWALDHLIIAATNLMDSADDLALYRDSQGLDADIVSIDDVFDNFNFGIRDGRAVQAFLGYAYRNWEKSPRYVVLVGDGSMDYRNFLNKNDSQIPTPPIVDQFGMFASDYGLGDIDGDGYLEMAVGRLPVKTSAGVLNYLDKLANYENGGNWRTNALISTDVRDQAGIYIEDGNYLSGFITDRTVDRADIEVIGSLPTRTKLIDGINSGLELSIYIGHGSANQLAQSTIMSTSDTSLLTNEVNPTVFMALGCLVGTFGTPGSDSIGEGMINAKGGAAALIAASTFVTASDGRILAEDFLDDVYTVSSDRLGESWIRGKNRLTDYGRIPASKGFQLLGDPAAALGDPQSSRADVPAGPGRGTYEEWRSWAFAPVLTDLSVNTDPEVDSDGDHVSNYDEFMAGTDPLDGNSHLEIREINRVAGSTQLIRWPSAGGRQYRLEGSTNINGPYTVVADDVDATAPLNELLYQDTSPVKYFRISVK